LQGQSAFSKKKLKNHNKGFKRDGGSPKGGKKGQKKTGLCVFCSSKELGWKVGGGPIHTVGVMVRSHWARRVSAQRKEEEATENVPLEKRVRKKH